MADIRRAVTTVISGKNVTATVANGAALTYTENLSNHDAFLKPFRQAPFLARMLTLLLCALHLGRMLARFVAVPGKSYHPPNGALL